VATVRLQAHQPEAGVTHDLIRDVAAELGLGLMRLQPDRRHLEDVFLEGGTRA
jgi:ABC-2 type transport system ATP-binding protein